MDGGRMRAVLRGIQTLWKRPVVLCGSLAVHLSPLRCSPVMISSTHAQSLSNPHRRNTHHMGSSLPWENTVGDSPSKQLHNVQMLITDQQERSRRNIIIPHIHCFCFTPLSAYIFIFVGAGEAGLFLMCKCILISLNCMLLDSWPRILFQKFGI